MEMKKRLFMTFKTDENKKVSIGVDSPRSNVTEAEIIAVMDTILTSDIFAPNGEAFVEKVGAKIVETGTTEFDLEL